MIFSNDKLNIYICKGYPSTLTEDCIYLTPNYWDDYGYKTSFLVYLCIGKRIIPLDMAKIATFDEIDLVDYITKEKSLPDNSFSLGQTEKYYELLSEFENKIRESFFISMKDLAFDINIKEKAISTDVFKKSFVRFLTLKTITDIFSPLSHGILPSKKLSFSYSFPKSYHCDKEMFFNLDYENDVNNSFAIIGSNGCGKTTFIKDLISNIYLKDFIDKRITFLNNRNNQNFNLVINISFTGFDDYAMFDNDIEKEVAFESGLPMYHSFTIDNVKEKLHVNFLNLLGSLEKIEKFKNYFSLFNESLFFDIDLLEEINTLDVLNDVKHKSSLVAKILEKYNHLSSGQKFIFATTYKLLMS